MLKINKIENNEVKKLLKKYEKKEKKIPIISGIIAITSLILGIVYLIPSITGILSSLFSMQGLILLIFGVILFLILGNFILDILLGILNIFR